MLAKFSGLNLKGPYLSLEKEKENLCVVFQKFHVAVVNNS